MDGATVDGFVEHGFVKIEKAFPRSVAEECAELLWTETGCDRNDPTTWTKPVHWVFDMAQRPFVEAANTPVLHDAFDALVGRGRWVRRSSLGSFPLRFPHPDEPDDAGWHIEGSYLSPASERYLTNVFSANRALLMLFLFTDVDEDNAPTRIRVGSHLDIPPVLAPFGEAGVSSFDIAAEIARASAHRPLAHATGAPGEVYLCHPFLVHAAQPNHGSRPRFMAQPPLHPAQPIDADRPSGAYSPVERAIRRGLGREAQAR